MPALGDEFRSAREARGLTLSDVSEKLHIRSVYLNAIEAEDWKAIGAPVYVRGFIRTYARFLGLDGEAAIAQYNEAVPQERPTSTAGPVHVAEDERSGPSIWAIIGIIAAVILVAFVGYEWWSYAQGSSQAEIAGSASPSPAATTAATPVAESGSPKPGAAPVGPAKAPSSAAAAAAATDTATSVPAAAPATSPVPANSSGEPAAAPSPAPTGRLVTSAHQLALRLTERSWLRVTVDGKTVIEGIYPAGTTRTFAGNAADVRAGNGGGVTISVNGRPAALLGKAGDVVEQRYSL